MKRLILAALVAAAAVAAPAPAGAATEHVLLQVARAADCRFSPALLAAGAVRVVPELGLWRVPEAGSAPLIATLRSRGALVRAQPDRLVGRLEVIQPTDPLVPEQWWRTAVGVDQLEPPGPGRPVTVVDSGLDLAHPEFAARPDTVALNPQTAGGRDSHGTMVASLVAAPADGVGMVGIYPQAALRVWDAAPGRELRTSEIVAGVLAAARSAPGVINLSLGGRLHDPLIEQAVGLAYAAGSLVVAAAGNGRSEGNPPEYPAGFHHVLTVAATGRSDEVAPFSTASRYVDLAAPGLDMVVATPALAGESGYRAGISGTSFAAPLVAGAAAWVWTLRPELDNTQLFEVMRRSARDVAAPGRDDDTGFGVLNVPAALIFPAPISDTREPNEDVEFVENVGFFAIGSGPLTSPARPRTTIAARLDLVEDPRDVYRVWVPAHMQTDATLTPDSDVSLSAWKPTAGTVVDDTSGRLTLSAKPGKAVEKVTIRNAGARGVFAYLSAELGGSATEASYRLAVTTKKLPAPKPKPRVVQR